MRRLAVVVLALAACVPVRLATSATNASPGFVYGVAAGEITATSAVLWTRAPRPGVVTFSLTANGQGVDGLVKARAADDLTVSVPVHRLRPGTRYSFRFRQGSVSSAAGRFETAPAPTADAPIRFAFSGDADATPGANGKPGFNDFEVYGRMAAERNDFNVNLGDTIYSDSELSGSRPALTLAAKWQKYRWGLALPALRRLRAGAGLYSQWDDHEFVNDFSRSEDGEALYQAGVKAFTDYAPVTYSAANGLYRTFRWGRNLQLFFLDERSFRSAEARSACTTAGIPDLAPTAPQAVRSAFVTLVPALAQPPAQACVDAIDDPHRTLLGARQLERFLADVHRSTATWKVVVNEDPIQQLYELPYDRWEGYAAERTRVLEELERAKNVVFLTTDAHANLIGEVRLKTLEPGGPVGTGIWEVVTGPVATNSFSREIDAATGRPGSGLAVTSLFLKAALPHGLGMRCAATDVYSYAEVAVTRATLTVTPKTATGARVREKTGAPCGLVLQAKP